MKYRITLTFPLFLLLVAFINNDGNKTESIDRLSLFELQEKLNIDTPSYYTSNDSSLIKAGEEIITKGKTSLLSDYTTSKVSKFYNCTSCHALTFENYNSSPDSIFHQNKNNNKSHLQGSSFYGIINRKSWFNDDYAKKYGALVDSARNSLKGSIQLCSEVCSQGRKISSNEMNAVLAYFSSLELKVKDLNLSQENKKIITEAIQTKSNTEKALNLIDKSYALKSPAHYNPIPQDVKQGYKITDTLNLSDGKYTYENSCKHCHRMGGESNLVFDDYKVTYKWLAKKFKNGSLYKTIREGTPSKAGHRPYMPFYSKERLSNQQVENLRAFIESKAK